MLDDLDMGLPSFGDTYINPQNGQRYPEYNLPKTLVTTLVSGYSTKLRYRIVKRWEELEAKQEQALPAFQLPQSFSGEITTMKPSWYFAAG
jgi:phage regulator Rha-like protein